MKTQMLIFIMAVICTAGMVFISEAASGEDQEWKYFGESSANFWYYGTKNIENSRKGIVSVWGKALAKGKEGIDDKIRLLQRFGGHTKGYENYSYTISLFEIDCANRKNRVASVGDYDKKGNVLESVSVENYPWNPISAGTIIDNLHKIVCPQK